MKSKFLYGAMALATVLSACTSEVLEPATADFSAVKGHDLVSKGMTITATNGSDTRVDAGGWELTDRVGMAWYDVKGDITGEQTAADYAAKKGTDADKKIYANNILSVKSDFSAFETRANIYQGAYFVYSPWGYMSQIGELKFKVNGTQEADFNTERYNKVPWISASKYIAAANAPQNGDYTESYVLNPVQNVVKVKATPSAGVQSALASYTIGSVTLTAKDVQQNGTTTLGTNIFASEMTVDPNALPDDATSTNTDKAVKAMVTPEYAAATATATTAMGVDYTLDAARELRVFMFPTNGENYIASSGKDVIIPSTTVKIPVKNATGTEIGYFEVTENDVLADNAAAINKLGKFLTPCVFDANGNYLAGGFGGTPYVPGTTTTTIVDDGTTTTTPTPDPAYNDVDPATGVATPGLEVVSNADGTVTKIMHYQYTTTSGQTVQTTVTPAVPGIEGKTLTQILRTDAGKPTFVNIPVTLTADNFHFSDYISNIAEWNERVTLVNALAGGTTPNVVSFIIDGEIDFANAIPVPACNTLKVTAVTGGSMKVTGTATYPANMEGSAVAADLHEGDTGKEPEMIVAENAVLNVSSTTNGVKFGTETAQTTTSVDGYINLTTTTAAVDMGSSVGNKGSIYIFENATENVANGKSAIVKNAAGTSVIYLADLANLVDAGAIDNLLANAPVSDFKVIGYTLTMNNTASTAAINLMLVDGNVIGNDRNVEFNHVVSNGNSSITADAKDINLHCVNIAGGDFDTKSANINVTEEVLGKAACTSHITIDGIANLTLIDCTTAGDLKMTVKGAGTVTGVKTTAPVVTVETGVKSELKSI